jgi:quinoprotein glucose dehydrogenase
VRHERLWALCALVLAAFTVVDARQDRRAPAAGAARAYDGWPSYGGGPEQIRYSSLSQINRSNVGQLAVAWTYDSRETGGLQTNPIVVDGVLFTTTPKHRVVALDAATGSVRWTFDSGLEGRGPNRGVITGRAAMPDFTDRQFGTRSAQTGKPIEVQSQGDRS